MGATGEEECVQTVVCWCRRVQLRTDTGAGMYVCAGPGVCLCVRVCEGCGCAQVCARVQVKRVGACGHVHRGAAPVRSCGPRWRPPCGECGSSIRQAEMPFKFWTLSSDTQIGNS